MNNISDFLSTFYAQRARYRSILEENTGYTNVKDTISQGPALSAWRSSASSDLLQLSALCPRQGTPLNQVCKVFLDACKKVLSTLDNLLANFEASASSFGSIFLMKPVALASLNSHSLHVKALRIIVSYQDDLSSHISLCFSRAEMITERKRFPTTVLEQLQASFSTSEYPDVGEMARLSKATGLSSRQIRMWFINRRSRTKRRTRQSNCSGEESDNNSISSPIKMAGQPPLATEDTDIGSSTTMDSFGDFRHTDVEFYQVLLNSSTRSNWNDYAEFFKI